MPAYVYSESVIKFNNNSQSGPVCYTNDPLVLVSYSLSAMRRHVSAVLAHTTLNLVGFREFYIIIIKKVYTFV